MNSNIYLIFLNLLAVSWFNIPIVEGIIGGYEAKEGQFKYQVSIQANGQHICGGAILNEQHVLTAAECFIDVNENFFDAIYTIVFGAHDLKSRSSNTITERVKTIYVPSFYKRINTNPNINNDIFVSNWNIALAKLMQPLNILQNNFVRLVKLPDIVKRYSKFVGKKVTVSGFGIENLNARAADKGRGIFDVCRENCVKLKFAEATVIHKLACVRWSGLLLEDKHLCALMTVPASTKGGVCDGDIGGPLVLPKENTIIGVLTKTQNDCNEAEIPAVYSRVTDFLNFIEQAKAGENLYNIRSAIYRQQKKMIGTQEVETEELIEYFKFI